MTIKKPYLSIVKFFIVLGGFTLLSMNALAEINNQFEKIVGRQGKISYSKTVNSGCKVFLELNDLEVSTGIWRCKDVINKQIESTQEMANVAYEIIIYFKLEDEIRLKQWFYINVQKLNDNWPLIENINKNKDWPVNVFTYLKTRYPDRKEQVLAYREMLKQNILSESVYLPFIRMFDLFGCKLTLTKRFADPLFYDDHYFTKDYLISSRLFPKSELNKDVYPEFKSPIEFEGVCKR